MSRKRQSYEAGHKRKYLVIIDESPECDRAVYYASRRAAHTDSGMVMLLVIEPHDRHQQWLGVTDKAQAHEAANAVLDRFSSRANGAAGITPERVIRDGDKAQKILNLIDEDEDIAIPGACRRNRHRRTEAAREQYRQDGWRIPNPGRHRARTLERRGTRRVVVIARG